MKLIKQIDTVTGEDVVGKIQKEALDFDVTDAFYQHSQYNASTTWTVQHNLNKKPSVEIVDSAGSLVKGHIFYISSNTLNIVFNYPLAGIAYCN